MPSLPVRLADQALYASRVYGPARLNAWRRAGELRRVQDNTRRIGARDVIVFATLRNEAVRMKAFFEHYEQLGADHFILVDNGSTDHFSDVVAGRDNVSVWRTEGSYKAAAFGMAWLNELLRRYGEGHWCVVVDPDELLVYPLCDTRDLHELGDFLDRQHRSVLHCHLVDMYGPGSVAQTHYEEGEDPFAAAPHFDPFFYVESFDPTSAGTWLRGGPRLRVLFRKTPTKAPAVNKTPFIRWRRGFLYISSTHTLAPRRLNVRFAKERLETTGCLAHFKFVSLLQTKAKEELERGEHYEGSIEYKAYHSSLSDDGLNLSYDGSWRYEGWDSFARAGLMTRGDWF